MYQHLQFSHLQTTRGFCSGNNVSSLNNRKLLPSDSKYWPHNICLHPISHFWLCNLHFSLQSWLPWSHEVSLLAHPFKSLFRGHAVVSFRESCINATPSEGVKVTTAYCYFPAMPLCAKILSIPLMGSQFWNSQNHSTASWEYSMNWVASFSTFSSLHMKKCILLKMTLSIHYLTITSQPRKITYIFIIYFNCRFVTKKLELV